MRLLAPPLLAAAIAAIGGRRGSVGRPYRSVEASPLLSRAGVLRAAGTGLAGVLVPARTWAIPPSTQQQDSAPQVREVIIYKPPSVKEQSTSEAIALAKHLKARGAKMYGAYWCSHCFNQRSMFGAAAAARLDYVECAAGGADAQPKVCATKQIEGYPTWEIGGKFYSGERSLAELAQLSGYKGGGFE